ncbi:MAG: outer membrane beta-barrel protein [Gammaproteobacteria bacterium]|nr:outer membrane beta-barrel protein [Gammaproteobacteria bacterium]
MLKKSLLTILAISVASCAYASDQAGNSDATLQLLKANKHAKPSSLNQYYDRQYYYKKRTVDFYFGAQGGAAITSFKRTFGANTIRNSDTNPEGGGYLGVGAMFDKFYFGGEGYAKYMDIYNKQTSGNSYLKLNLKYAFGLDGIIGFFTTKNVLLYARAGILASRFYVKTNDAATYSTDNRKRTLIGYNFGAGVDLYITHHISIRPEYDFTLYNSYKYTYAGTSNKYSPKNNQFSIGITFHML